MVIFNKYKFRRQNQDYKKLFSIEKTKLLKVLPKTAKIEHVGSTAVPGLGGKGMLDIAVSVPKKDIINCKIKLEKIGFVYKKKIKDNQRKFFEKKIIYNSKERRVHLHLTYANSQMWQEFMLFRNYLKKHSECIKQYEAVKKIALKKAQGNGKIYRQCKEPFIRRIIKKAKREGLL